MNKIEEILRKHITDDSVIQSILNDFASDDKSYISCAIDIYNYIWHNYTKSPIGEVQRYHIASLIKSMWNRN